MADMLEQPFNEKFLAPLGYDTLLLMLVDMIQATGEESAAIPRETLIGEIQRLSEVVRVQNAVADYEAAEKRAGFEVDIEAEDRDAARCHRTEGETGGGNVCRECGKEIHGTSWEVGPHSYHPGCGDSLMGRLGGRSGK